MATSLTLLQQIARGGSGLQPTGSSNADLAKALSKIGTSKPVHLPSGGAAAKGASHDQTFWHWLGDIVDRPRRAVENGFKASIDAGSDIGEMVGKGKFDAGRALGDLGNVASAGFRGLTSNDKADQMSTSDLIEYGTDKIGAHVKGYKDVQDNVNPVLKGAAGLVGDIAFDPLTYVPIPGGKGLSKLLGTATRETVPKAIEKTAISDVARNVDTRGVSGYKPMARMTESKVAETDPIGMTTEVAKLTEVQRRAAHDNALQGLGPWFKEHVNEALYKIKLPKSGAVATELGGKGDAKFTNRFGTHASWNLVKTFTPKHIADVAELPQKVAGLKRAAVIKEATLPDLKVAEALLDSKGVKMTIDFGGKHLLIAPSELIESLSSHSAQADKAVRAALFNTDSAVPFTKIAEAQVIATLGGDEAAVSAHLASATKRVKEGAIPNFLADGKTEARLAGGKRNKISSDQLRGDLTEAIMQNAVPAVKIHNDAAAAYATRWGHEYGEISDELKGSIEALVSDPAQLDKAISAISGIPARAETLGARGETLPESVSKGAEVTVQELPPGVAGATDAAVKTADRAAKGDEAGARAAANTGATNAARDAKALPLPESEEIGDAAAKMSADAYRGATNGFLRFIDPVGQLFRFDRGMEGTGLTQILSSLGVARRGSVTHYAEKIRAIGRAGHMPVAEGQTRTVAQEALEHYFKGTTSENPAVQGLVAPIAEVMSRFVPAQAIGSGTTALSGVFTRSATPLEWFATRFGEDARYPGLSKVSIDIEAAERTAKLTGTSPLAAAYAQIGEQAHLIDDVPQFMNSLNVMAHRAATEAALMAQAEEQLIKLGLAAKKPTTGMVRATWSKNTPLAGFASPDLRLSPDGLRAMQAFNAAMTPKRGQPGLEQFLQKYFDPFQQVWKTGMTVVRLGHHIRNFVGNLTMNFMAEGVRFFTQSTRDTAKILASHNTYTGFDASRMLAALGKDEYKGGGAHLMTVKINGKGVPLSSDDVYRELKNKGVLNSFHDVQGLDQATNVGGVAEELATKNALQKGADALTKNRGLQATAGKLSENIDHTSKIQHAAQMLRKFEHDGYVTARFGQRIVPKSQDELFTLIAEKVRQYHPDGTTLTEFERRYLKRVMPFYGWFRGALPALAESAMMHPGRAAVFPKASYNLAVASGVHPDSLADPFPDDQLFPSYLADNVLGPQFKIGGSYFMASPGVATVDMANTFKDGVGQGLLGMTSPLLRLPVEVTSGHSLTTGAAIKDWSDYVDQQLPLVSNVASLTGYSPTGSAAGLVAGQGLDETLQIRKGNKDQGTGFLQALISNLGGVTVTNESQPNMIKSAEYEQKDKAKPLMDGQATRF